MKKLLTAICLVTPLLAQVNTSAAMPAEEYACKVQTVSVRIGVVMVQASDLADARYGAEHSTATRLDGVKEAVQSVMQCIRWPEDRFDDAALQKFVEAMPR